MGHAALGSPLSEAALERLDSLIDEVASFEDVKKELFLEHLKGARIYLLGAMPAEYKFSLDTLNETATGLSDPALQTLVTRAVSALLQAAKDAQAPFVEVWHRPKLPNFDIEEEGGRSELYRFFHGFATKLGVFYPTHYIFATFPSFQAAGNAVRKLKELGFGSDEIVAVPAAEMFRFFDEMETHVGLWGSIMASLSRFFGTEEVFADVNFCQSQEGAGFLAIYCPQEAEAEHVRDLLVPIGPLSMQLYLPGGIRSLWAGKSPGPQGHHSKEN